MKNKELAFDYMYGFLYQDANIASRLDASVDIEDEDRQELAAILSDMKMINKASTTFDEIQLESVRKAVAYNSRNMENTIETIMSLKVSLQDIIKDAKKAYQYVLGMYVVAFYLGVGLILTAIVFAALDKTILATAFGTIGLVDIVSHFIFKPPLELQSSRSNLAQLMVALTNWFADLMNLNSYLSIKGSDITLDEIERISATQNTNTEKVLKMIETYSEPVNRKKDQATG